MHGEARTAPTFSQAQKKARALSKDTKAIGPDIGKLPTVAEAAAHYLSWFKEHRKSYRETEATVNAHILPTLGNHLVTELTSKTIRQWQERIATQPARQRSSKLSTKPAYREKAITSEAKRARNHRLPHPDRAQGHPQQGLPGWDGFRRHRLAAREALRERRRAGHPLPDRGRIHPLGQRLPP